MGFKDSRELFEHENKNAKRGKKWVNPQLNDDGNRYFVPVQDIHAGAFIYVDELGPRCDTKEEAAAYL